jgi:hypothetical protein
VSLWSFEVMQIVTSRNNLGAGTNESYLNLVVVMLLLLLLLLFCCCCCCFVVVVVVVIVVVHGGDVDKIENSLIPLSVSVILLNVNV